MHAEAITYTRQTLNYPMPHFTVAQDDPETGKRVESDGSAYSASPPKLKLGDAKIPGGRFLLGSAQDLSFVFDNEMWPHLIEVKPFEISRTAVTNAEFLDFVRDDGYRRAEF
jgi:iron(II)-dependent oxidoreductase